MTTNLSIHVSEIAARNSFIVSVWRLSRFREFVYFVVVSTLLGAAAANGALGWRLMLVLLANWLVVGFAFMFNDVEDAPDDALDPSKVSRNPVSSGAITATTGRRLSGLVALLSLGTFSLLGIGPFLVGAVTVALGYLYSARRIRWKAVPLLDLISHSLMLAGCQFAASYLAFSHQIGGRFILPFAFLMAASVYGQLFNQLRDFTSDTRAGIKNTAARMGRDAASHLMHLWLVVGALCGFVSFVFVLAIPWWVIALGLFAALAFCWQPFLRTHKSDAITSQAAVQKPLEAATTLALVVWFVSPFLPWLFAPK